MHQASGRCNWGKGSLKGVREVYRASGRYTGIRNMERVSGRSNGRQGVVKRVREV